MKLNILLILLLTIYSNSLYSQEKGLAKNDIIIEVPQNGQIENGIYVCNRFDWKIEIPQGYTVTPIARVEELQKKGYGAVKDAMPDGMQVRSNPPHLIGFGIDTRNSFSASFEPMAGTKQMTLKEHKNFIAKLLSDSYTKFEAARFELNTTDLKIGKYDFYRIQVKLYIMKTGELVMTQELYNCYVDNKDLLSATINYSSEEVGQLLRENFMKSLTK